MIFPMSGGMDKRFIGGGLRLAAGSTAPLRLDHGYFEDEVRPMLGSILLKKGWLTHDKLDAALQAARISGMRLGETLLSRGWLFEPELASALAEQFGLRYVDLVRHPLDPSAAGLLPTEVARRGSSVRAAGRQHARGAASRPRRTACRKGCST